VAHGVSGQILTAGTINAINSLENPTAVQPASFSGAHVTGGVLKLDLRAKSVVMLTLR
jgi:alpha-N-arabinofuranosidase